MATLQQIRERVSRKLQDPDNTSRSAEVIDDEINRSVRYYENQRFFFNEEEVSITLIEGQKEVPNIPADLISELYVNGLMVIDAQVKIDLEKLHPDQFFNRDQDQTGRPYFYTYKNDEFLVLPVPQRDYELRFRYLKKQDVLTGNSDTNDFTENAEDLIMLHTLKNMYAEDKQDTNLSAYYDGLERSELKAIRKRTDDLNGAGYLQAKTILDNYQYY